MASYILKIINRFADGWDVGCRTELPFTETGRLQVEQVCAENQKFDFEYSKFEMPLISYPNQDIF